MTNKQKKELKLDVETLEEWNTENKSDIIRIELDKAQKNKDFDARLYSGYIGVMAEKFVAELTGGVLAKKKNQAGHDIVVNNMLISVKSSSSLKEPYFAIKYNTAYDSNITVLVHYKDKKYNIKYYGSTEALLGYCNIDNYCQRFTMPVKKIDKLIHQDKLTQLHEGNKMKNTPLTEVQTLENQLELARKREAQTKVTTPSILNALPIKTPSILSAVPKKAKKAKKAKKYNKHLMPNKQIHKLIINNNDLIAEVNELYNSGISRAKIVTLVNDAFKSKLKKQKLYALRTMIDSNSKRTPHKNDKLSKNGYYYIRIAKPKFNVDHLKKMLIK